MSGARRARAGEPEPAPLPDGFEVGHWTDADAQTGCTAILAPPGARGGIDVRGGGPGTRETDVLAPVSNAPEVTGVVLAGRSAFGLSAADGVARWLEGQGRGYPTPGGRIPIVPAAVVYDMLAGRPEVRPGPEEGAAAADAARGGVPQRGRIGVGAGTASGKVLGRERATSTGVGYAASVLPTGETVAAVAVANPVGDVVGSDGEVLAGPHREDGTLGRSSDLLAEMAQLALPGPRQSTTLACVCTDAPLDKTACTIIARMASAGIARAVEPVFTPYDGDVVFCLASGAEQPGREHVLAVGVAAAEAVAEAIRDAALSAR